ncbi:MAG: hypothetical protein NTX16_03850 [Actinobacteria bacterium]|nr:hypothetical protein [Actinomycetota bacterium]
MDADGCLWICINPGCPELAAGELEAEDLAGGGVSTSWGTGSDVEDQALAARLERLIDYYEDTIEELHAQCAGGGEEGADAGGGGAPRITARGMKIARVGRNVLRFRAVVVDGAVQAPTRR